MTIVITFCAFLLFFVSAPAAGSERNGERGEEREQDGVFDVAHRSSPWTGGSLPEEACDPPHRAARLRR